MIRRIRWAAALMLVLASMQVACVSTKARALGWSAADKDSIPAADSARARR